MTREIGGGLNKKPEKTSSHGSFCLMCGVVDVQRQKDASKPNPTKEGVLKASGEKNRRMGLDVVLKVRRGWLGRIIWQKELALIL